MCVLRGPQSRETPLSRGCCLVAVPRKQLSRLPALLFIPLGWNILLSESPAQWWRLVAGPQKQLLGFPQAQTSFKSQGPWAETAASWQGHKNSLSLSLLSLPPSLSLSLSLSLSVSLSLCVDFVYQKHSSKKQHICLSTYLYIQNHAWHARHLFCVAASAVW